MRTTQTPSIPKILANTPTGTQAAMLNAVIANPHPRIALPTIASNYNVSLADLQTILNRHGYPDTSKMRAAAERLNTQATERAGTADSEEPALARIAVADLHPDPDNLREHVHGVATTDDVSSSNAPADDIEQLADSIREIGLLQPIIVRKAEDGRLVIVAGHRRVAAVKTLRWSHVDVIIRPAMRPDDVIAAMLIENGQRRDLDPIEEARGIRKLKAANSLSDAAVARKIGRSQGHVSGRLALLNLTPEEQDAIRSGEITLTGGVNLGRLTSGKTKKSSKGHVSVPFFGPTHDAATKAAARCKRLGHGRKLNGGTACGPCWESVIRADERDHLQVANAHRDDCVTCGSPIESGDE